MPDVLERNLGEEFKRLAQPEGEAGALSPEEQAASEAELERKKKAASVRPKRQITEELHARLQSHRLLCGCAHTAHTPTPSYSAPRSPLPGPTFRALRQAIKVLAAHLCPPARASRSPSAPLVLYTTLPRANLLAPGGRNCSTATHVVRLPWPAWAILSGHSGAGSSL